MTKTKAAYKSTVVRITPQRWREAKQRALDREISLQCLLTEALEEKLKKTRSARSRNETA
jgi:predicted HicB family RNase H-like nuclease